ncbi:hypothetical protein SAMN05216553_110277 [Lentzea fradiae]|uniref:Uncharacterized protein n=1 Tax=Lentzea fradiae TaxID=200378 RepID=A0A1G7WBV8_9PSEU|nr:hypothetical protein [Lentzea fradiae]SDG69374.1 hypothetical protein SAMN05216553_110277 [Lentzea fradiae]
MNLAGNSTWQISCGDGGTYALFVRDALGISGPAADAIPPLTPPVPRRKAAVSPPELAQDWGRWWRECTASGPGREPLGLPEGLRAAYREWGAFTSPESSRRRDDVRRGFDDTIREVVRDLEQELGRQPVFRLEVLQAPVQGQFWLRLGDAKVFASEELLLSRHLAAPLDAVIRGLLH